MRQMYSNYEVPYGSTVGRNAKTKFSASNNSEKHKQKTYPSTYEVHETKLYNGRALQ